MMVSYTKARAESIGVRCTVGLMERPERMICLIAGALLDLLEPALWLLAVLSNLTALQRIAFTWRATRDAALLRMLLVAAVLLAPVAVVAQSEAPGTESLPERRWAAAVEAYQLGDVEPLIREFNTDAARDSVIGDHVRYLLAEALSRRDDLAGARGAALSVVDRYPKSRLATRADGAGAPDQLVSRRARAARRALSPRDDRRGARPAGRRGADLPGRAPARARERLCGGRERPDRRARGLRHPLASADAGPAHRSSRAAPPGQRARCRDGRGRAHRRRGQGRRDRDARAPCHRRERAPAQPL